MYWGRFSLSHPSFFVPLCTRGSECEAIKIIAHQGPLGRYLTVGQQRTFDKTGKCPQSKGLCLLCIRRAVCMCYINGKDNTVGIDVHNARPFVPPLYNTVDQAGGYRREKCVTIEDAPFIPAPVCMPSSALTAERCATGAVGYNGWFVDQRRLMYGHPESMPPPASVLN